jgi:hypothetical protein
MVEPNTATVQQPTTEPSQPEPQPIPTPTPEIPLVQRVAKVEPDKPKPAEPSNEFGLTKEDYEKVQNDPVLSKFYKSMQSGLTKKTQEIAEIRKSLESQTGQKWTPERVQQLINDPEFLQSAQVVAGTTNQQGMTNEEWSALTDAEKAEIIGLKKEVNQLKQINQMTLVSQQDSQLKQTYANYEPQKVDNLLSQMMSGRVNATREHLWKVIDYESAVERAYRLGRQDERGGNSDRINSASMDGMNAQPNNSIQPEKEESSLNFFQRIARQRLAEAKTGKPQRM